MTTESVNQYRIEVCNTCGGLVGWERLRDGCCVLCEREDGTRFVTVEEVGPREAPRGYGTADYS